MRGGAAGLVVALLLAGAWPATAQPPPAEGTLLSDAAGDVAASVQGQAAPAPLPAGVYSGVDLRSFRLVEADRDVTFTFEVEDLVPASQDTSDGFGIELFFRHADREFRLGIGHLIPAVSDSWSSVLQARDVGTTDWQQLWFSFSDAVGDPAADSVSVTVSRILLADALGAPPFPGRVLEDMHAGSWSGSSRVSVVGASPEASPGVAATDLMPDAGGAVASYAIRLGPQQTGHARLTSAQPFRASNGEAGTFVLNVTAHNVGDAPDSFTLRAAQAMSGAELRIPEPAFELAAGATRSFQVLLTVPFAHEHGAIRSVVLEMQSASDAGSTGRLLLGILYLPIPQPAGHHDTLYLHTGDDPTPLRPVTAAAPGAYGVDSWLNTLEDDPSDGGLGSPPVMHSIVGSESEWWIALDPGLQLGLDFDLARVGRLVLPVASSAPVLGASVSAEVVVVRSGDEMRRLATMAPTAPADLTPGEPVTFSGDVVPESSADLVPFAAGQDLVLIVRLDASQPATAVSPVLLSGGLLQLPLLDYQDPLDPMLASAPLVEQEGMAAGQAGGGGDKGAPGPAVALALLALVAAAARRRRKS